ncbi:PorV/PorQ family protein [bacterium]|nr:PorV/PorQ family protein [bacterium]
MKRSLNKILIGLALLFVLPMSIFAQNYAKVGIVGGQFLKLGMSADVLGMGSASLAHINNANAAFWNPGGMVNVKNSSVALSQVQWLADITYGSGAFVKNMNALGTMGLSFAYLNSGEIEETDYLNQQGTGNTFVYTNLLLGFSWAKYLTDRFAFGITMKYLNEDYGFQDDINGDEVTSSTLAFDIGTQYQTMFPRLKMGLSIRNFGPELKPAGAYLDIIGYNAEEQNFVTDSEEGFKSYQIPMYFSAGIAYKIIVNPQFPLCVAIDLVSPSDNVERVNIGVQQKIANTLALRAGYIINHNSAGLSAGFGLNFKGIEVNYSYANYSILNFVQSFSLVYTF